MAQELFIDASAWVALAHTKDNDHEAAKETYARTLQEYQKFVTTNLVVAETHALLLRRMGYSPAIQFLDVLEKSSRVLYVYSAKDLEDEAGEILRKYKDHAFSYADAVSFAVMKQRGITDVFTYDQHFRAMGFRIVK